jgi:hypothetical protein
MISVLQEIQALNTASATTISLAFASPVTDGSSLHIFGSCANAGTPTMSCADSLNGSYGAFLDSINSTVGGQINNHWKFDNAAGGITTVTITFSASVTFRLIWVREIGQSAGFLTHAGQEQNLPGTGANAVSSGNATPSSQPGLISAMVQEVVGAGTGYSAGTGFTAGIAGWGSTPTALSESKRFTTTSAQAATFTDSNGATGNSITLAAFFKEAAPVFTPFTQTQFFVNETIVQQ